LGNFERDVPCPPEVSEFLWKVRELNRMGPQEYLEFLNQFSSMHPPTRETNKESDEPFEL
jgi:hypothetical protein